jgi:hypothetical protein
MKAHYLSEYPSFDKDDKKLTRVFIFFIFVILISQLLQFINNRLVEDRYRAAEIRSQAEIQASQTCLSENSVFQRMLLNLALIKDEQERVSIQQRLKEAEEKNAAGMRVILAESAVSPGEYKELVNKMADRFVAYDVSSRIFLGLLKDGNDETISEFLTNDLRPKFRAYQEQHKIYLDRLSSDLAKERKMISNSSGFAAWVFLLMGLSPFIYLLHKLLLFYFLSRGRKNTGFTF